MRTDAGSVVRREAFAVAGRGRLLLPAGLVVFGVAVAVYLVAIATHPAAAMLKGFDLGVYLQGGELVRHSPGTLYTWHQPGHPGIQFTYPPIAAMIFAVLSLVSLRTVEDVAVVVSIAALVATLWIAFRELGVTARAPRWGATLLLAGICLWLEPMQRALFLGQVEPVLMALVVWDICQPDTRRPWKGAGVGLAAGIKLVPVIFIGYLVLTRRLRAAAVAIAVFAATIVAGFVALPHASVQWWLHGDFFQAGRTGFVGVISNQSLRGALTRLVGSVAHGQLPWFAAAVVVGVLGLAAATMLHRAGYTFEGLMACALMGLLASPISWDHHWVWIAPILAVLAVTALRARDALLRAGLFAAAAVLVLVFADWPRFWNSKDGLLQGGLIWWAPSTSYGHGDNPKYPEYSWHGLQLIVGNLYLLTGGVLFLAMVGVTFAQLRRSNRLPMPWR